MDLNFTGLLKKVDRLMLLTVIGPTLLATLYFGVLA